MLTQEGTVLRDRKCKLFLNESTKSHDFDQYVGQSFEVRLAASDDSDVWDPFKAKLLHITKPQTGRITRNYWVSCVVLTFQEESDRFKLLQLGETYQFVFVFSQKKERKGI